MFGFLPIGGAPFGAEYFVLGTPAPPTAFETLVAKGTGDFVFLVELDAYRGAANTPTLIDPFGGLPFGAISLTATDLDEIVTFRYATHDYVTDASASIPLTLYRPYVKTAMTVERRLPLEPTREAVGAQWGDIEFVDPRDAAGTSYWADIIDDGRVAGRQVRVLLGGRDWDVTRGLWTDWPYADFQPVFAGLASGWVPGETSLRVPVRDRTYLLERPFQSVLYAGTGGLEGGAEMAGRPKPITRGITKNVSPVLIDPVALIWQYADAAGQVDALYEKGGAVFAYAGDTTNLYAGSTPAGQYRTDNSKGLFQLGSEPQGQITADVRGSFPAAGYVTRVIDLARWALLETLGIQEVDESAFVSLSGACPYDAGFFIGAEPVSAVEVIGSILASAGAQLGVGRNGLLKPYRIAAPGAVAAASYDERHIVSVEPAELLPVYYRRSVGYAKNWTVQTSDLLAPPTVDAARRQFLANEYRTAAWFDGTVSTAYASALDAAQLDTILANQADAQAVANALGALWGTQRYLFTVTLMSQPLALDLGAQVSITYPISILAEGRIGVIVGERVEAATNQVTLTVLI